MIAARQQGPRAEPAEGCSIAVATIQPDGSPQVSPVWAKRDGDDVLFSTTVDRRKTKNLQADPRVTVLVQPADNPYPYPYAEYAEFNPTAGQDAERVVVRVKARKVVGRV
ncbi:pyridoxamine 5'-phosphate oxidase family protein [Streptomyces sp. UC4497]